jgi:hypothetical protein
MKTATLTAIVFITLYTLAAIFAYGSKNYKMKTTDKTRITAAEIQF